MWVIEHSASPPCWIAERIHPVSGYDVTFQRKLAKRFTNQEDARHEILRLGLPGSWTVQQIGWIR